MKGGIGERVGGQKGSIVGSSASAKKKGRKEAKDAGGGGSSRATTPSSAAVEGKRTHCSSLIMKIFSKSATPASCVLFWCV